MSKLLFVDDNRDTADALADLAIALGQPGACGGATAIHFRQARPSSSYASTCHCRTPTDVTFAVRFATAARHVRGLR